MNQDVTSHPTHREGLFNAKIIHGIELSLALALSVAWIVYHYRFFLHADGLWRDEVNSVDLSNSATIADIWRNLQYDSFPMLWHLVLRVWIRSGIGSTDSGLRLLGLITGLAILAVLWANARRFRFTSPIGALALLGFSSAVICYGDSIRAYGLGILLELLTFGLIWDVATRPTRLRIAVAFVVALASVHMLFYNGVILAAICCGGIAVALLDRRWDRAGIIFAIGLACAASMLIYLPEIHRRDTFRMIFFHDSSFGWLRANFVDAVGYDAANRVSFNTHSAAMWEIAFAFAMFVGTAALLADRLLAKGTVRTHVLVYHLVTLTVGIGGYWWFLARLNYVLQPWYFLALLALVAVCADGLISSVPIPGLRLIVCLAAVHFCLGTAEPVWFDAGLQRSDIKCASMMLKYMSNPGDIIVVSPWNYGVTLQRYFNGPAEMISLPPTKFLAYQDYDLIIPLMHDAHALDSVTSRIAQALLEGHSVFLFGNFSNPALYKESGQTAMDNENFGWNADGYNKYASDKIESFAVHHARHSATLAVQTNDVSAYERPGVIMLKGSIDPTSLH
jgi:hypothetical protein